jgi:hypothetical protein
MEESRQMGASVPPERPQVATRQQQGGTPQPGQQAGGQAGSGQMQGTQFTDWASI